jgi:hypothetical protein
MQKIQARKLGELVQHKGVWIPQNAIVPDKDGREQVTEWTLSIGQLLQ